jgi:hypothetical protein
VAKTLKIITCSEPPALTAAQRARAYKLASQINAANMPKGVHPIERAAVIAQAYWGSKGVHLTVGFMESIQADLRDRILSHMNAWNTVAGANVKFRWTQTSPQVRISRGRGGYWSYLGVDVLAIPKNQQTMNLEGFTMNSPESEFVRVIRHETGHTLGMPHEHLRPALVALLDRAKTESYFMRTQGWSQSDVDAQVLTPLTESSLLGATPADALSIMCYQIPGECTKSGKPITGGVDIDDFDKQCVTSLYPLAVTPPPHPPVGGKKTFSFGYDPATGAVTAVSVA